MKLLRIKIELRQGRLAKIRQNLYTVCRINTLKQEAGGSTMSEKKDIVEIEEVLVDNGSLKLVKTIDGSLEIVNQDNVMRRNFTLSISNMDKRNEKFMRFIINQKSFKDSLKVLMYDYLRENGEEDISNTLKIK